MAGGGGKERRGRRRGGAVGGGHGNEERWLLPYADMITLLLALFVVLYAISSVNTSKAQALEQALAKAFNGEKPAISNTPSTPSSTRSPLEGSPSNAFGAQGQRVMTLQQAVLQAAARQAETDRLREVQRKLEAYAKRHGFKNKVQSRIDNRGLVIRLVTDRVLFDNGQADLQEPAKPLLTTIAHLLGTLPNKIRVEGHTDSMPISTDRFASNWELSVLRAATVTRYLIGHGLHAGRLGAAGYADRMPLAPNKTAAGRARNRRVEIVILRQEITKADLARQARNLAPSVEGLDGPGAGDSSPKSTAAPGGGGGGPRIDPAVRPR